MIKDRIWTLVSRKLSGEATASELAEIDEITNSNQGKELYLQAIYEYWAAPAEKDQEFLEATYHLHLHRLKAKGFDLESDPDKEEDASLSLKDLVSAPKRSSKKFFISGAIVTLIGALFFVFYSPTIPQKLSEPKIELTSEVSTKNGSRTRILLPDGSYVWLNGSSKLIYDNKHFGDTLREVTLSGEAYFDVVKNPRIPFVIHTNNMRIKVLGTAFNVKAYPGEKNTETSLVRGSIEVTVKGRRKKIMMKPNDKLIVLNDAGHGADSPADQSPQVAADEASYTMQHVTFSPEDNTILETAWVENKLQFDKEAFEDIAVKMERWYGVVIRFNDEKLKGVRMTGTFEKQTVTEALQALQFISPFTFTIKNDTITIAK